MSNQLIVLALFDTGQGVQCRIFLVVNFFRIFEIIFCFVVAIYYLVHDVEAIHNLRYLLRAFWKSFLKYE